MGHKDFLILLSKKRYEVQRSPLRTAKIGKVVF